MNNNLKEKSSYNNGTLCWRCARLDCSWMQNLIPIAGWTAKKTVIKYYSNGSVAKAPSYKVIACPEFVATEKRRVSE